MSALSTLYLPSIVNFNILPTDQIVAGLLGDGETVNLLQYYCA